MTAWHVSSHGNRTRSGGKASTGADGSGSRVAGSREPEQQGCFLALELWTAGGNLIQIAST